MDHHGPASRVRMLLYSEHMQESAHEHHVLRSEQLPWCEHRQSSRNSCLCKLCSRSSDALQAGQVATFCFLGLHV